MQEADYRYESTGECAAAPGSLVVAGVRREEKDLVCFYPLKVKRDIDLTEDRLDQKRNALLPMPRRLP